MMAWDNELKKSRVRFKRITARVRASVSAAYFGPEDSCIVCQCGAANHNLVITCVGLRSVYCLKCEDSSSRPASLCARFPYD